MCLLMVKSSTKKRKKNPVFLTELPNPVYGFDLKFLTIWRLFCKNPCLKLSVALYYYISTSLLLKITKLNSSVVCLLSG